jgi:hypothetical protein
VLAVLGYRRPLRRRDRWSRPALLAHQDHALRRLREYAYQRSRFYQDFHAGLASAPLSALPVLTKQTLMESFDSVVTHPDLRLPWLPAVIAPPLRRHVAERLDDIRAYVESGA